MPLPLPHTAFPQGDTVPLTVTMLTNEHGQPWSATDAQTLDWSQLTAELLGPDGVLRTSMLDPVTGTYERYATRLRTGAGDYPGWPAGVYRYRVYYRRQAGSYWRPGDPQFTVLRGTFALTATP